MAKLKDIAERAGVSIRTVSRTLSGAPDVGAATRARVEKIARRLDYRPDPLARGLKLKRGYAISVILHTPNELHLAKVCVLERELRAAGYTTQLVFSAGPEAEAGHLADALAARSAAVILFGTAKEKKVARHLEKLHAGGHPYVLIDRGPSPELDVVRIDRAAGVAGAVRFLIEGGHRAIHYLGPEGGGRTEGFQRAFREAKLEPPAGWALTGFPASEEGGRRAARALVRRHPEATAVFTYSDIFAYGVLAGLAGRGVGVPERISVIGFDDRSPSQYVTPPLSTVAHPHEEVGRAAAEVILGKIAGRIGPGEGSRLIVPRFVERASTRALRHS